MWHHQQAASMWRMWQRSVMAWRRRGISISNSSVGGVVKSPAEGGGSVISIIQLWRRGEASGVSAKQL